jgi:hypothetical protein
VRQAESRQGGNLPGHPPRFPFRLIKWKEFSREIERAVDEISHLDGEIKKLEARATPPSSPPAGTEARNQEARSRRRRHPARTAHT